MSEVADIMPPKGKLIFLGGFLVLDNGKYVVIWKQKGDRWKLHPDIWNSSLPAQGH
jgi:hypothetical protein